MVIWDNGTSKIASPRIEKFETEAKGREKVRYNHYFINFIYNPNLTCTQKTETNKRHVYHPATLETKESSEVKRLELE